MGLTQDTSGSHEREAEGGSREGGLAGTGLQTQKLTPKPLLFWAVIPGITLSPWTAAHVTPSEQGLGFYLIYFLYSPQGVQGKIHASKGWGTLCPQVNASGQDLGTEWEEDLEPCSQSSPGWGSSKECVHVHCSPGH